MKKLALWHTKTFRPILDHNDLEPLMAVLGFVALPVQSPSGKNAWKEYAFHAMRGPQEDVDERCYLLGEQLRGEREDREEEENPLKLPLEHPVRPRLPFPRIDGLHIITYNTFVDAVAFHIGADKVPDHFHVRCVSSRLLHHRYLRRPSCRKCSFQNIYYFAAQHFLCAGACLFIGSTTECLTRHSGEWGMIADEWARKKCWSTETGRSIKPLCMLPSSRQHSPSPFNLRRQSRRVWYRSRKSCPPRNTSPSRSRIPGINERPNFVTEPFYF